MRTGELEWVFRTVPQAGDEGVETWENDSWTYSGITHPEDVAVAERILQERGA